MSGSPKYSSAELDRQRQEKLEADRRREAQQAELRRKAEEERQRIQRLNNLIQQGKVRCQEIESLLKQSPIYEADLTQLTQRLQQERDRLNSIKQESELGLTKLNQIVTDLNTAMDRKQRDDAAKKLKDDLEKLQFAHTQLQDRCDRLLSQEVLKFDPEGKAEAQLLINALQEAITSGNLPHAQSALLAAQQSVDRHIQQVSDRRDLWQQAKGEAEANLGEMQGLVAGLESDSVFMRWQHHQFQTLEAFISEAEANIQQEKFALVDTNLSALKERISQMLEEVDHAQLKADERDYKSNAMIEVLQEMGFNIKHHQLEHPNHPASAVVIGAATHSGKAISISVPVEGDVLYDVKGFTVAAASCDQAEQVLEQMHGILEEHYGVQMGEVMWEGKDEPIRNLRRADELPQSRISRQA